MGTDWCINVVMAISVYSRRASVAGISLHIRTEFCQHSITQSSWQLFHWHTAHTHTLIAPCVLTHRIVYRADDVSYQPVSFLRNRTKRSLPTFLCGVKEHHHSDEVSMLSANLFGSADRAESLLNWRMVHRQTRVNFTPIRHMHTCTYTHTHNTHMTSAYLHMHTYEHRHARLRAHIDACTHVHTHAHTHTRTHTHTHMYAPCAHT